MVIHHLLSGRILQVVVSIVAIHCAAEDHRMLLFIGSLTWDLLISPKMLRATTFWPTTNKFCGICHDLSIVCLLISGAPSRQSHPEVEELPDALQDLPLALQSGDSSEDFQKPLAARLATLKGVPSLLSHVEGPSGPGATWKSSIGYQDIPNDGSSFKHG